MPLIIVKDNIINLKVDAVVSPSYINLQATDDVSKVIFDAAGFAEVQEMCHALKEYEVGQSVITPGFNSKAKYIIHTVGPVWQGGNEDESNILYLAYTSALSLALEKQCQTIAFPVISSGTFGFPLNLAIQVAYDAITDFLKDHEMGVSLVVHDSISFLISKKTLIRFNQYLRNEIKPDYQMMYRYQVDMPIDNLWDNLEETFSVRLFHYIDHLGVSEKEVYKRANISHKLFSKIRSNINYKPSKTTVLALSLALRLNLHEANDLLKRAGFTLSRSKKLDVFIEYCLEHKEYDISKINIFLFENNLPLLGSV